MSVQRFDRGELSPAHKTEEGYLYIDGRATRAGVFTYKKTDGTVSRELRPPEEVGSADSLASLARKPITNLHPAKFVDADNADKYAVGIVDPEVEWETNHADGFVRVRGTVQRADGVKAIEAGAHELSAGYTADLDETPGIWKDCAGAEHPYDAIQRDIRYNHLAIVPKGRAGSEARLRLDDAAIMINDDETPTRQLELSTMTTIKIDGRDFAAEETPAMQRAINEVQEKRDAAVTDAGDFKKKFEEMKEEYDAMKAEYDVLKADMAKKAAEEEDAKGDEKTDSDQERVDFANARFGLIETARTLKLDGFDDVLEIKATNDEIKRTIVLSRFDAEEIPTDAHVDAAFSLMQKDIAKQRADAPTPNDRLAHNLLRADTTQKTDVLADAQAGYIERIKALNTKTSSN